MIKRLRDIFIPFTGILVVLLAWQVVAISGTINPAIFPGPLEVLSSAVLRIPPAAVLTHVRVSLVRVSEGFLLGALLGISLGIASGWYRWLGRMIWTPIDLLRPIPPLAWISLALIWFGLGENSKVFIIFLGSFFPVVTNTYKGMITIEPDLLRVAQTMGLKGARLLLQVALPAAMPDIATGIRIGWSLSFGALIAAEILAAKEGLGYLIMNARELGEISVIVYGILLIGLLNLATTYMIQEFVLNRQLKWHFGNLNHE